MRSPEFSGPSAPEEARAPAQSYHGITVSVAAGKGGTGKTLVATSLAISLATTGRSVQLLDCDVEEPNAALLLRPKIDKSDRVTVLCPTVDEETCTGCGLCARTCQFSAIAAMRGKVITFPNLCVGCGACAYVCPTDAITEVPRPVGVVEHGVTAEGIDFWHGRVDVGILRSGLVLAAVKGQADAARIVIIDAPPGTACPMQEALADSDFCLLITEPTPFGLSDLGAAVETCHALSLPCAVILNRAGDDDAAVQSYCDEHGLPLLLRIPEERRIAEAYSRGETLVQAFPQWRPRLIEALETALAHVQCDET